MTPPQHTLGRSDVSFWRPLGVLSMFCAFRARRLLSKHSTTSKLPCLAFFDARIQTAMRLREVTLRNLLSMQSGIPDFDTARPDPFKGNPDPFRKAVYEHPGHDYSVRRRSAAQSIEVRMLAWCCDELIWPSCWRMSLSRDSEYLLAKDYSVPHWSQPTF